MFNPVPFLALGAVAIGYFGAIDHTDRQFAEQPAPSIAAFTAAPNLSVQDFVARLPETVQDPHCDTVQAITAALHQDFAETKQASWSNSGTKDMELWASDLMGTWTLVHVESDAMACIVASGFGWSEGMTAQDVLQSAPVSS